MHFKRLKRFGYINCIVTIDDLINRSEYELFKKKLVHSLHHLLPPYRISDLRNRGHIFQLPEYATDLHKKSFIIRTLGYINMFNKIAGPAMFCLYVFRCFRCF